MQGYAGNLRHFTDWAVSACVATLAKLEPALVKRPKSAWLRTSCDSRACPVWSASIASSHVRPALRYPRAVQNR